MNKKSNGLFLRFAALSGMGWLLDAALLMALVGLAHWPASAANVVSSCTAATTVFLLSRQTLFRKAPRAAGWRVVAYVGYSLAVIFIASAALGSIAHALAQPGLGALDNASATGIAALAKVIVTPPQLLLNFLVSRFLSERSLAPRRRPSSDESAPPAPPHSQGVSRLATGVTIAAHRSGSPDA